ncbi:MAG: hypothetical protein J2P27_13885 [Actinobacteria bacterium]|nr:hypothetical protein [Actinomycetota bacterium]
MELDRRTLNKLIIEAAIEAASEGVPVDMPRQLDDQHPVIPLAVDRDGDVAFAALLSWSEQDSGWKPSLCNETLVKGDDGYWCPSGGSSGMPPRYYPLAARRPAEPAGLHIRLYGGDSQASGDGVKGWRTAALYISAEVETLRIADRRLPVPFHGYVSVVMPNRSHAEVAAIGNDGSVLQTINLRRSYTDLFREQRRRDPDNWPSKIK